jgi:hypothetical protein
VLDSLSGVTIRRVPNFITAFRQKWMERSVMPNFKTPLPAEPLVERPLASVEESYGVRTSRYRGEHQLPRDGGMAPAMP